MSRTQIQAWIWEAGVHLGFEDVCSKIEELIGDSAILEGLKDLQYTRLLFACRKLKKLTKSINATRDYGKPVEDLLTVVINLLRNKIVYDYKTLIEQLVSLYQSTILFEYTLANDYGDTERDREDSLSLSLPFNEEKWEKVKRILDFKNDLYKDMVRKIASFELYYKSLVQPESKKNYDLLCSSLRSKIKKLLHDLMALVKKFRQPYIVNVCSNPNELKRLNFVYHRIILDNIENNTVSAEALHRMIDQLPRLSTSSVESNHSDCTIVETSFTLPTTGDNKIPYRFSSNENINQRIDNDGGKPIGEPFIHSNARNFNITVNDLGQEREKSLQCRHIKRKKYDIVVLKGEEYIKENLNVTDDIKVNKINEGSDRICNNGVKSNILHTDVSEELGKTITPLPDVLRVSDKATTLQTDVSKEPDNSFNQLCTDISKLDNLITSVKDLVKELEKKCQLMKVKRDAVLRHNNASDNQKCNSELPNLNDCAVESQQNGNISDELINEEATKSSKNDSSEISSYCNPVINIVECSKKKNEATLNFNISTNILNENVEKNDNVKIQDNNSTDISKDVNTSKFQDNINDSESNMKSKNNTSSNNDNKSISMPSLSLQADIIDMDISNTNNIKPDSLGIKMSTPNEGEQTDGGCKHDNSMPNLSTYDVHDRSNNKNIKDYNSSFMTPNPLEKKRTSGDDIGGNCNDTSVSNLTNYEGNDNPRERSITEPSDSSKIKDMDCCIPSNEESNEDPTRCGDNDAHNTRNILESSLSDAHNTRNILESSLSDAHNTRNILESSSVSNLSLQGKLPSSFVNLNRLSSKVIKRIERHSFILVNEMYPNTKGMNRSPEGLSKISIRVTPQHDLNDSPAIILETNILDYSDSRKVSLQDSPASGKRKLDIEDGLEEASVKKSRSVAVEECCTSESSETITQKESLLSQQPPESFEMFLKILKEKSEITENFSSELPTITSPEISLLINSAAESGNDCDKNILNSAYKTSLQSSGPRSPATPQKEVSVSTVEQEGKGRELTGTESSSENSLKDFAPQKLMEKLLAKLHDIISSDDEDKDRDDDEDKDRDDDDDEDKDRDDDDDEDKDRDDDEDKDRDDDDDEDKDRDDDDDEDKDRDDDEGNNSKHRKDKKVAMQRKKKKNSPLDSEEITEQEEKKTNNHNKKKKKTKATKNNANSEDEVKENTENNDNVNSKNTVTRSKLNSHTEEGLSLSTSSSDLVVVNKHRPHVILADVFTDGSSTNAKVSPNSSSTEFYTPDSTKELVSVDDDEDDISVVFDSFPVHNTRHRSKIRLSQTQASKPPTVVNGDLGKPKRQQASKSTRGKPYDLNKERKLR